jgi:hypothetical protein
MRREKWGSYCDTQDSLLRALYGLKHNRAVSVRCLGHETRSTVRDVRAALRPDFLSPAVRYTEPISEHIKPR